MGVLLPFLWLVCVVETLILRVEHDETVSSDISEVLSRILPSPQPPVVGNYNQLASARFKYVEALGRIIII